MAIKKKISKPKKASADNLFDSIKSLFDEQKKLAEKRDAEVNLQLTALHTELAQQGRSLKGEMTELSSSLRDEMGQQNISLRAEIGTQIVGLKKDLTEGIAPIFEDLYERDRKAELRITNEIRGVIVLIDNLRTELKDAMTPTQMIVDHETTLKTTAIESKISRPRSIR